MCKQDIKLPRSLALVMKDELQLIIKDNLHIHLFAFLQLLQFHLTEAVNIIHKA